jgi:hypothetical protein
MSTHSTKLKLGGIGLSLLLLVTPLQLAWGQEALPGDEPVEVEATVQVEPPLNEVAEEIVAIDESSLTQQVFLPVVQQSGDAGAVREEHDEESAEVSAAFTHAWVPGPCLYVPDTARGLWDDVPGAGAVDAALFWFVEDNADDEQCSFFTQIPGGVLTASFSRLQFRVAVGDGARLTIRVYRFNGASCGMVMTTYTTPTTADNNQFSTRTLSLPTGYSVCRIELTLTDDPNNSGAIRTSALIDFIQIQNTATPPAIAWQEIFSNNQE